MWQRMSVEEWLYGLVVRLSKREVEMGLMRIMAIIIVSVVSV